MLKLCPLMATILNFRLTQKKHIFCRVPSNVHSCNVCLDWFTGFRGEFFLTFYVGSHVKTMSADGGHLKFPIDTKLITL